MAESSSQSIVISADPARIAEVICDYASYPTWAQAIKAAEDNGAASAKLLHT